jgi:hypothetical protein
VLQVVESPSVRSAGLLKQVLVVVLVERVGPLQAPVLLLLLLLLPLLLVTLLLVVEGSEDLHQLIYGLELECAE